MRQRRWIWTLVRLAVAVLIIAAALAFLDVELLLRESARVSWAALLLAALFNVLTVCLLAVRWYVMVRRFVPGTFWWHARHYWASILFNLFTPAALGSDVYRIVLLRGTAQRGFSLFGLILQERIVGLLGQGLFFLLCLLWLRAGPWAGSDGVPASLLISTGWVLLAVVMGCLASFWVGRATLAWFARWLPEVWQRRLLEVGDALKPPSIGILAILLGITLASVFTWTLAVAALAEDLASTASFAESGLAAVLGEIARWLPLSLQGIGTREAVYAVTFELMAHAPEAGFLTGAIVYLLNTVVLLLFGGVTIAYGWRKDRVT